MKITCIHILLFMLAMCSQYNTNYGHHKTVKVMKMGSKHRLKSKVRSSVKKKTRYMVRSKNRNKQMNRYKQRNKNRNRNRNKVIFGKAKDNTHRMEKQNEINHVQKQSSIRQPYIEASQLDYKGEQQRLNKQQQAQNEQPQQPDKQSTSQTDTQPDSQPESQTNTQTDSQTDSQTDNQSDSQSDGQTDSQIENVVYLRDQDEPTKVKANVVQGYLEKEQQKYSDYQKTASNRDVYANYKVGDYYLIQKPVYNKQEQKSGKFTFYLNHNAFYFVDSEQKDNYRGVVNSINIQELIDDDEPQLIAQGVCCHNVGKIQQWHQLKLKQHDKTQLNEQDKYFVDSYKKQLKEDGTYRQINPEVKKLVKDQFMWQGMYCFGLNLRVYNKIVANYWTICSYSEYNVELLNMRVREVMVINELRKQGIYNVEFIVTDRLKNSNQQRLDQIDIREHYWQYGQEQSWPNSCQIRNNNGHIQSPIRIEESLFEEIKMDRQMSKEEIKQFVEQNYQNNQIKIDMRQMTGSYSGRNFHRYYKDPIYTFNGLHANYFIGNFGSMEFNDPQSQYTYRPTSGFQAFVMSFKTDVEHQLDVRVDLELQISFFNVSHPECYDTFKSLKQYAQNQLVYGRYDDNNSDLYNFEQALADCQELVVSIPFQKNNNYGSDLLFINSLFSEDMFEELPQPDYLEQYMGKINKPIVFGKDLDPFQTTDNFLKLAEECQPGSLKCLFDQQPRQDSFYIYKGTQTSPPCKRIIWVVYKMPYYINGQQLQIIRDNMRMYQKNKQNARQTFTKITWNDLHQFKILRMTDYRDIECESSKQKFEAYLYRLSYGKDDDEKYTTTSTQQQRSTMSRSKRMEMVKQQMKEEFRLFNRRDESSDAKLSMRRYIRRLAYVNINTAKKMLEWNSDDWVEMEDKDKHDYGSDKQSVVMVNGTVQNQIYGYLSKQEYQKVQGVIKYSNKKNQQSNIQVSNLQSVYDLNTQPGLQRQAETEDERINTGSGNTADFEAKYKMVL